MSLTSSESRDLKKLADAVVDVSKILKAMNENLLGLANNMTAMKDFRENGENLTKSLKAFREGPE